ncbi:MAG: competence/damage-inducible protein A, partial [Chlamydiia bacterium]|nr:competence/damage-inducible protein A [Chlamydiia bacterium]
MATCEIISIGNEILSGSTINSNAAYIAQQLESIGLPCSRHLALADEPAILSAELHAALDRSALVVTTGGLGPTLDDLTRSVLAELFHCDQALNSAVLAHLERRYGAGTPTLQDQATIPTAAQPFLNHIGTAPGLAFNDGKRRLIALPGVPDEMRALMTEQALPWIQALHLV